MRLFHTGGSTAVVFHGGRLYTPHEIPSEVGAPFWRSRSGASRGVFLKRGLILPSIRSDAHIDGPASLQAGIVAVYSYCDQTAEAAFDVRLQSHTTGTVVEIHPLPWRRADGSEPVHFGDPVTWEYTLAPTGSPIRVRVTLPRNFPLRGIDVALWAASAPHHSESDDDGEPVAVTSRYRISAKGGRLVIRHIVSGHVAAELEWFRGELIVPEGMPRGLYDDLIPVDEPSKPRLLVREEQQSPPRVRYHVFQPPDHNGGAVVGSFEFDPACPETLEGANVFGTPLTEAILRDLGMETDTASPASSR